MNYKRLLTSMLTIFMLASTAIPAFAAEPNEVTDPLPNGGKSSITLEVKGTSGGGGDTPIDPPPIDPTDIIIATVPVELPIIMDLEGNITVPTDATITNHSTDKGIKVTEITAVLESDWAAANYSDDFTTKADNAKELGLSLRGDTLKADGTFPITDGNWNIAKDNSLPLNMGAKLPKQTETAKTKIATVGFTISWSGLDGADGGSDPDAGKDNSGGSGEVNPPVEAWDTNPMTLAEITALNLSFDSTTGAIKKLNNNVSGEINLPTSVDRVKVTAISKNAFMECNKLTGVTIPPTVTGIPENAFNCCSLLTSVDIPDSVTTIGFAAFADCSSLSSITIPYGVLTMDTSVFDCCTSLESVAISNSVTYIGDYTFSECTSLKSITIPDSVITMGQSVFMGSPNITTIIISKPKDSISGAPWGATKATVNWLG